MSLEQCVSAYTYVDSNNCFSSYELIVKQVQENGLFLKELDEKLRDQYNIVMEAVKNNGSAIQYASIRLQSCDLLIKEALHELLIRVQTVFNSIKKSMSRGDDLEDDCIQNLDEKINPDIQEVLNNFCLLYTTTLPHLKNCTSTHTFLLRGLRSVLDISNTFNHYLEGINLTGIHILARDIISAFPDNKELVVSTVSIDSFCFNYIDDSLKNDKDIIVTSLNSLLEPYIFVTTCSKGKLLSFFEHVDHLYNRMIALCQIDKQSIHSFFSKFSVLLEYACSHLTQFLVDQLFEKFHILFEPYNDNIRFVLPLVTANCYVLYYTSERLKNDEHLVLHAIKNYPIAIKLASKNLQQSRDFVLRAIYVNCNVLEHAIYFNSDPEFIAQAIEINPSMLLRLDFPTLEDRRKAESILRIS